MYMSRQALSRVITSVENDLNLKLFYRGKQGLTPTNDMLELVPHISRILEEYDYFSSLGQERIREINVCVWDGIGDFLARDFVPLFSSAHQDLILNLEGTSDIICRSLLEMGECDYAIVTDETDFGAFESDYLCSGRLCAIVNADHPFYRKKHLTLDELCSQRIIGYSRKNLFYQKAAQLIVKQGYMLNFSCKVSSPNAAIHLTRQNLGITLIWDCGFLSDLSDGSLAVIPIAKHEYNCKFYLLHATEIREEKRAFRTELLNWIGQKS